MKIKALYNSSLSEMLITLTFTAYGLFSMNVMR